MHAQARKQFPGSISWVQGYISTWWPVAPPALIFSNAALHWVGDHQALMPRLFACLAPGGQIAARKCLTPPPPLSGLPHGAARPGAVAIASCPASRHTPIRCRRMTITRSSPAMPPRSIFGRRIIFTRSIASTRWWRVVSGTRSFLT